MWTQLPPEKRHTNPYPILAHVYSGQMAGWMKTPLGTEVDLGPGHIVLDGVPAPARGAQQPPLFGPSLLCHGRLSELLVSSCRVWNKVPEGSTLIFGDTCDVQYQYINKED